MINLFPFKFENLGKYNLITNDAGDFFYCNNKNLDNLIFKNINEDFYKFLESKGYADLICASMKKEF